MKETAKRLLPGRYLRYRVRRHQQHIRERHGIPRLAEQWADQHGTRVLRGPLEGLRYPPGMLREIDAPVAKLAGCYEHHLHDHLPSSGTVIDIGAAEGYYAVGLALRGCQVIAYEMDPHLRRLLAELADLNRVAVDIRGECQERNLLEMPPPDFLLSDCEGAETEILTPRVLDHLEPTRLLVETHGTHDEMKSRLRGYTMIEPDSYVRPELDGFPEAARAELRNMDQTWLLR